MTFVVGENCIKCKHTDCVEVCPVDCFYEGPNFLVIHPDECIDCALCVPMCPVDAIFTEDELPEDQKEFLALNAELAAIWPNIKDNEARAGRCGGVEGRAGEAEAAGALSGLLARTVLPADGVSVARCEYAGLAQVLQ